MDKKELLCKLTEYEIGLLKAKGGLLRAGMQDVSCYDNEIEKIEFAIKQIQMLAVSEKEAEPEEMPEDEVKISEDPYYCIPESAFNLCRRLEDKCDRNIDAMKESGAHETYDKLRYADIVKLKDACRRFLTDWAIHDPARSEK